MKSKKIKEKINNISIYTAKIFEELASIKDYIVLDRDNDSDRLGIFLNSEDGEIYLSLDGYKRMSLENAMYYMETYGYVNCGDFE